MSDKVQTVLKSKDASNDYASLDEEIDSTPTGMNENFKTPSKCRENGDSEKGIRDEGYEASKNIDKEKTVMAYSSSAKTFLKSIIDKSKSGSIK